MTPLTRSRSVALLGEQAPPRVSAAPPPTRANAWEDVADLSASFGVHLFQWQEVVLQSAMGERSDGTWAAKQVGLSVPRQNGKSQLLVARALAGALLFGEKKIIISAHAQDTARESFQKFLDIRDASPALDERIDKVMNALNREFIKFKNGATVQFKARTVSGSRGFSCDCLLLDEAQILGMPAWVSINSTMSARPNPQVWLLGTPPTPEDNGEVFTSIRSAAVEGRSKTLAYLEWSADAKDDPALEETRAKANPAWHELINHEIVQGEFETYPPARFSLDRLGIWHSESHAAVIPSDEWKALGAEAPPGLSVPPSALAVDISHDNVIAIAAAWKQDESCHVELVAVDVQQDTLGAVEWLVERAGRRIPVVIDSYSPANRMVAALKAAHIRVIVTSSGSDMARACGMFYDDAIAGRLSHAAQPHLDVALSGARRRPIGNAGGWGWDRKEPTSNIAPLVAATLARYGAAIDTKTRTGRVVTA